jgi:uncharacterized protein YfaT (DUF1175 family)
VIEKEIKLVNRIIEEAIWHGADCGGSYSQNEEGLRKSISEWLKYKGLNHKYTVKEKSCKHCPVFAWQICKRGGIVGKSKEDN